MASYTAIAHSALHTRPFKNRVFLKCPNFVNSQLWLPLKVNKSQKHFLLKFHCPKNERNIKENFALEFKKWSNQKDKGFFKTCAIWGPLVRFYRHLSLRPIISNDPISPLKASRCRLVCGGTEMQFYATSHFFSPFIIFRLRTVMGILMIL